MAVTLPFDGSPLRVRWSFSTKDDPFTLTICLFGGGGWLELCLGADGVESLTIGFVFGAMAELNVGVASGVVYIQFGIVLVLKVVESPQKGQETDLTGFVRAGGGLEFFGMLTITMELYIALTYKDPGKAYGKAKFTVSLAISILSVTFTFEAEREPPVPGPTRASPTRSVPPTGAPTAAPSAPKSESTPCEHNASSGPPSPTASAPTACACGCRCTCHRAWPPTRPSCCPPSPTS